MGPKNTAYLEKSQLLELGMANMDVAASLRNHASRRIALVKP
jgi:hypothetical protein